jgi:hypothetical protein
VAVVIVLLVLVVGTRVTGQDLPFLPSEDKADDAGSASGSGTEIGGNGAQAGEPGDDGSLGFSPDDPIAPSQRDVADAVLSTGDLPDGWEEEATSSTPGSGPFCEGGDGLTDGAFVVSNRTFRRGEDGGAIANAVHSFDSTEGAQRFTAEAREAIAACDGEALPGSQLQVTSGTGDLGDEQVHADLHSDAGGGTIDFVRRGTVVVVLLVVSEDAADLDTGASALQRILERL